MTETKPIIAHILSLDDFNTEEDLCALIMIIAITLREQLSPECAQSISSVGEICIRLMKMLEAKGIMSESEAKKKAKAIMEAFHQEQSEIVKTEDFQKHMKEIKLQEEETLLN